MPHERVIKIPALDYDYYANHVGKNAIVSVNHLIGQVCFPNGWEAVIKYYGVANRVSYIRAEWKQCGETRVTGGYDPMPTEIPMLDMVVKIERLPDLLPKEPTYVYVWRPVVGGMEVFSSESAEAFLSRVENRVIMYDITSTVASVFQNMAFIGTMHKKEVM